MNHVAFLLFRLAAKIMPRERAEWLEAMRAELPHMPGHVALSWSAGCVITAIKQRLVPMKVGTLRIPGWVMFVEAIGAFAPLTASWYAVALDQPGVLHYSWRTISTHYLPFPGGPYVIAMLYAAVVVGLLGPIGLFFGLRYVVTGRGIASRMLGYSLVILPLLSVLVGIIAGYFVGPADFGVEWSHIVGFFGFILIPMACVLHLMYLERRESAQPAVAAV
jgi:hypothetical protein